MSQSVGTPAMRFGARDVQIMAGTFDDFSFDDVIQVLSLSRQCLRLLVRQGEAAFGEVLLKAGHVLAAHGPNTTDPAQVFMALGGRAVPGSGLSFAVYHTQPDGPYPPARGRLADLHALARRAATQAPAAARVAPAPVGPGPEDTLRIPPPPAQPPRPATTPVRAPAGPVAQAAPNAVSQPDIVLAPTLPITTADTVSKAVLADLQPLLRHELNQVGVQVREQAQMLAALEGRLQSLPQLVAAEVRLALAQRERDQAREAPPAPAPQPAAAGVSGAVVMAMAAGLVVLFGAVVVLAVVALR